MKFKNILFYLAIFVFLCVQISAQQTNPVVTNVAFSITGTTVTVTYDVSDSEQGSVTIIMIVSSDGGTTWGYNYGTASGDIGTTISTGTDKGITWTYSGGYAENFKMKIIANDETAGGSPCPGTAKVYYEGGPNNDGGGDYYSTIQIGDQCWLKENLNVGTRIDGSEEQTDNDPTNYIEKYCYDDNTANCNTYGGLYQWNEAMQYVITEGAQGICPTGWHIPSLSEFQTLAATVNSDGNALKAIGQGFFTGEGTNTSNFSAMLAGRRNDNGIFWDLVSDAYFWSSKEQGGYESSRAYYQTLNWFTSNIGGDLRTKIVGYSVRCVKN